MSSRQWFMEVLDAAGSKPRGKVPRQCPAHRDAAPSLSLHERISGNVGGDDISTLNNNAGKRLMIFCHAGCSWREILGALRVNGRVLHRVPPIDPAEWARRFCGHLSFPELEISGGRPAVSGYRLEAVHDYRGWLLERWRHPVTRAKDLRWWTKTDQGTIPGLMGKPMHELPLYRESEVRAALVMGETVVLTESESSVDALKGIVATTWAGGAACVPVQRVQGVLGDGRGVVLVPDMDVAGLDCAKGLAATLPMMKLLVGNMGEDAKDLYTRVGKHDFEVMIKQVMA